MTDRNALWTQGGSTSAEEDRALIAALIGSNGGVFKTTDLKVTATGTPDMNVHVAAGRCAIVGTESSSLQGVYVGWLDASKTVSIAAADGTNARIDLIVAKVQDAQYSGATNAFSVVAVTGTPSGTPAVPSAPANSIVLAQIAVGAGVSSINNGNITDKRTPTGAGHRFPTVASTSLYPATVSDGLAVYRASGDANEGPEFYNGSAWRKPWNMPWGEVASASITSSSSSFTSEADISGLSVTYTQVANRIYHVECSLQFAATTSVPDVVRAFLTDGSNTHLQRVDVAITSTSSAECAPIFYRETGSAGSVTRKIRAQRLSGTGTVNAFVSEGAITLVVKDMGPSGAPA